MKRILLVEPGYRNKFPPLGLMKIATYHKLRSDNVHFVKGCVAASQREKWDRVYVSTLFTFHWKITVDTIRFYQKSVAAPSDVVVGGVMATLMANELRTETGATVIEGLLEQPGVLDPDDKRQIDYLTPDYHILEDIDYQYGLTDAYIGYATRGCPNRCAFCAVNVIEPQFKDYLPLRRQVKCIEETFGSKQHLVLMDNNVVASDRFAEVISDIVDLGFHAGARLNGKARHVDFNQGIDLRLLTLEKMRLLATTAIRPLRIAFDHVSLKEEYEKCVRMAVDCGIIHLSNYVLYNFTDTPQDFYERLKLNVDLNQELGTYIYSFPMKFIPLDAKDRSHVGKHWNRRLLRGVQCILLATRGKVGTNTSFFERAFGRSAEEFIEIAMMPEEFIINRNRHENNGAGEWRSAYRSLDPAQCSEFMRSANAPATGPSDPVLERILQSRALK
jgi:hypothetical protein